MTHDLTTPEANDLVAEIDSVIQPIIQKWNLRRVGRTADWSPGGPALVYRITLDV